MLPAYLTTFNSALEKFREKFPREEWSKEFKNSLVNDFTFYSQRVEDSKIKYGDTIRFLNNEIVRATNLNSLLAVTEHQKTLCDLLEQLENFKLTEETVKDIHKCLMGTEFAWETQFKPELVGNFRNKIIPS